MDNLSMDNLQEDNVCVVNLQEDNVCVVYLPSASMPSEQQARLESMCSNVQN